MHIIVSIVLLTAAAVKQLDASGIGCLRSEPGHEYLGEQNVTSSGRPCVRWDEVQGAFRDYIRITFLALPDKNASNAKNFCRNPNNDSRGVWCFVNLLGNVQFCNVPRCISSTEAPTTVPSTIALPPTTTTAPKPTTATTTTTTVSTQAPSSTFFATETTSPAVRHAVLGWESEETSAIDDTISDYIKPVVMSNNFEELAAARPLDIVTETPSTPNTIYLTLKQPAGFGTGGVELSESGVTSTAADVTQQPARPFDAWEEDPSVSSENSVSADDTSAWQDTSSLSSSNNNNAADGMSDKIYSEDATGTVKVRTGSNLLLNARKEGAESENAKVVIQRSSQLSSSSSSTSLLSATSLITVTLLLSCL